MDTDRELLRQYAEDGNQAAFAEVVRRHTDLVYSAARRLVAGDAHLAQDVAQTVFTTLARKAGSLAGRENLLGWLHTTTRYAASVAVRGERRRRTHEQEAATMTHHETTTTEMDWLPLQSTLDEAVGRLGAQDREAVLLRFFQGKSHREVGAELGVNEVLARKRVERALERLHLHLSRRGVTLSTALLAGAITTHSVQAAPTGLAANLGKTALSRVAKVGLVTIFLECFTMTTKTKITVAAGAAILIALIGVGIWWFTQPAAPVPVSMVKASTSGKFAAPLASPVEAPKLPPTIPKPADPSTDPQANLKTAIADIVRYLRAGDDVGLLQTYAPPDFWEKYPNQLQETQARLDTDHQIYVQVWGSDPRKPDENELDNEIAQSYEDIQNQTPTYNAAGDEATYRFQSPVPDVIYPEVFVKINGKWYLKDPPR